MAANVAITWRHAVGQSDLDSTTKCVAYALSAHMNAKGEASPSRSRLATYASCHPKTAGRAVLKLEAVEFLLIERASGRRNRYVAVVPNQGHHYVPGSDSNQGHSYVPGSRTQPGTSERQSGDIQESNQGHSYVPRNDLEMKRNGAGALCVRCRAAPPAHEDAKLCPACAKTDLANVSLAQGRLE